MQDMFYLTSQETIFMFLHNAMFQQDLQESSCHFDFLKR